jgi:hypothetical protein
LTRQRSSALPVVGPDSNRDVESGPVGRAFDPDWSLGWFAFAVVWFALVGVGSYFLWESVL